MIDVDLDDEIIKSVITKEDVVKIIEEALKLNNIIEKNIHLSISSASKEGIRKINKKYRDVDKETDVLSFPMFSKEELDKIKFNQLEIGDIIICLDVVKAQSLEYNTGEKRELLYMITHGICHLLRIRS